MDDDEDVARDVVVPEVSQELTSLDPAKLHSASLARPLFFLPNTSEVSYSTARWDPVAVHCLRHGQYQRGRGPCCQVALIYTSTYGTVSCCVVLTEGPIPSTYIHHETSCPLAWMAAPSGNARIGAGRGYETPSTWSRRAG